VKIAPPRLGPVALVAVVALASCSLCVKNTHDAFPAELGFSPLEPFDSANATPPAEDATGPFPEKLGHVTYSKRNTVEVSHGTGYIRAAVGDVYTALGDARSSYIHVPGGGSCAEGPPGQGESQFPIAYTIHYASPSGVIGIGDVHWDIDYRAGVSTGTEQEPQVIGERYQKVWGISQIATMTGSLLAYPAFEGATTVTQVELEEWLDAPGCGNSEGTLRDLFYDLTQVVHGAPTTLCSVPAWSCVDPKPYAPR